jgi:hypothetical protein
MFHAMSFDLEVGVDMPEEDAKHEALFKGPN